MRKLKLLSLLMLICFSVGNVWADTPAAVGTTLFSEDFSGYSANDVPSGSVTTATGRAVYGDASVTYTCADNGTNKTMIYAANLASGTSPELLVGKSAGVFTITGIPSGDAQEITVSFKQNAQKLTASLSGTGYSTEYTSPKPTAAGEVSFDITVDDGADATFTLILSAGSSNVRLDDILVTVKTAGEGGGPAKTLSSVAVSGTPTKTAYNTGDNFDPAGLTVTGTYSDASTTPITSGITWSYNPSQTLALNQTSIGVTATVSGISSEEYNVAGLSVTDPVVSNWQVVAPADLVTGDVVVLTMLKNAVYYAAPNNGGTNAPTATAVAVVGDKLSNDPAETLQWEVTVVSDGVYQFSVGSDYLKCTDTNNGVKVGTGDYNTFDVVVENEKSYLHTTETMSSASNGRYLGIYNTQDWRCYGSVNNNIKDGSLVIFKDASAAATVAKPTISGDENFVTSTEVTLACTTSGASIYYTTDGTAPSSSSTPYSAPFTLTDNATVKAIAILGSDESAIAEKTFTKVTALATMAEVQAAAETTEKAINVSINNWVVTAVSGSQVWFADADNAKGILLYKSSHGFTAGKKLNGTVIGTKIKLYNLYPELTSLVASEVTVTDAETVSPRSVTIPTLNSNHPAEQGTIVKLENVTYSSSTSMLSDGVNSIAADNKFYSSLALIDGTTYNITGVVTYYKASDAAVVKIAPRTADDVEATSAVVIPTAANLAALKAAARGTYILTLTNAVVTYVNGNNAFIEDATGGALIYFASHGYSAGDCLNGDYQVVTTDYQGKFEITAMEPQAGAATTTAEIPLTTVSIATLNASFSSYESRRIKIVGANVTDDISGSDRNGAINDGAAVAVYASVANTITLNADDNVDIIGYPGFHNTDQQLTVWRQEDITVNEKDPAGIAFTPESETITDGDPWSAPAFTNPNNLDVTFGTSNDEVATVSNTGVVSLEGGYGTAVITAHTDGDATHNAGNATYTITVNDPSATPAYTMSFDLTRASYDDAADAQVVWNSNVVTFTANKNEGTKVTNYLAGNYSGTTLITETRFYTKNSLSFVPQAGVTITKVEWMSTAKGYATKLAAETWTNATVEVDATDDKLVNIIPSAAGEFSVTLTDAARATGITVYYTAESEKAKLTASISIDDMNMAVGDDDILLSAIAATSNPNKKAISYEVTSGTAVTIEGTGATAALHAAAEGTATITATIPDDLGNYTGATTSFMVTVAAAATLESIAISGEATELVYTEGQSFNPAGLTVMGHYSNGSDAEITSGIDWTFDPDPLTEGTTSVSVTATVETIYSDAIVVNGLTVSGPAPVGDNYVKVTASQTDWSGDYILVYEDGTDAYVWNGDYSDGANNYASATISSNTIAKPAAAAVITIAAASEGKYTLQVNGDKYFQDNGSNSKLIFADAIEDAAKVTISYETDWTKLQFSERCIRFNNTSGQTRFRFYAASGQQAVQLYKKDVPVKDLIRDGLSNGKWGTLCPKQNVENVEGATFYQISYLEENGGLPYNMVFDQISGTTLTAGQPYFFIANATEIRGNKTGDAVDAAGAGVNGFYGYIGDSPKPLSWQADYNPSGDNTYVIYGNMVTRLNGPTDLKSERCYININSTEPSRSASAPMPGRARFMINVGGHNTPTGMDQITNDQLQMSNKVIINGHLYILRSEKMYDATGRLVK